MHPKFSDFFRRREGGGAQPTEESGAPAPNSSAGHEEEIEIHGLDFGTAAGTAAGGEHEVEMDVLVGKAAGAGDGPSPDAAAGDEHEIEMDILVGQVVAPPDGTPDALVAEVPSSPSEGGIEHEDTWDTPTMLADLRPEDRVAGSVHAVADLDALEAPDIEDFDDLEEVET